MSVNDAPWRIVAAGAMLTLVPGYTLRRAWGKRLAHPFDELARSAALSISVAALLATITVATAGTVARFLAFVLALTIGAMAASAIRTTRGIVPRARLLWSRSDYLIAAVLAVFAVVAYRWASPLEGLDWEVGLQLIYVRQVASGLSTALPHIWLRPDIPVANGFFLWEYLLGAISVLAGVDPLIAATRSRWLIPALGIPAFFSWARAATGSTSTARRITAVALALAATQCINLSPDPLRALNEQRPLFSFLGTIHHADLALDVLLPLLLAEAWRCMHGPATGRAAALAALVYATFLIHHRELFQVAWYVGLAGLMVVLVDRAERPRRLRGWIAAMLVLVAVTGVAASATRMIPSVREAQVGEVENREASLRLLADSRTLYFEPLLRFRLHGTAPTPTPPPDTYGWLTLLALMFPLLLVARRRMLRLGIYFMLLWVLTMSFGWTQWLLQSLTYSEILITKVRFLPVFGMLLVGTCVAAASALGNAPVAIVAALAAGVAFAAAWPALVVRPVLLNAVAGYVLVAAIVIAFRARGTAIRRRRLPASAITCFAIAVALMLPAARADARHFWTAAVHDATEPSREIGVDNQAGVAAALLTALRTRVPPRSTVTVDPDSEQMIGAYAPVYGVPIPKGQVYHEAMFLAPPSGTDQSLATALRCADGRFSVPAAAARVGAQFMLVSGPCYATWQRLRGEERDTYPVVAADEHASQVLVQVPRR